MKECVHEQVKTKQENFKKRYFSYAIQKDQMDHRQPARPQFALDWSKF